MFLGFLNSGENTSTNIWKKKKLFSVNMHLMYTSIFSIYDVPVEWTFLDYFEA